MKFNTWPGVTWKYSGTFAGINAAEVTRDGTATARPVSELRDLGRARRLNAGPRSEIG